ncbi:hypothetical protein FRB95_004006 [Tulasnella sp. JGI-2019a]|nr:hypothetical protein FRB93_013429 [Tulasnella sp. JGI-2019a]KAG9030351.1 hypothetical protein FRB95_004006 [Tulasnella sp. JGI-2019a]
MENQPLLPQTQGDHHNEDRHIARHEEWRMKTGEKLESEHVHKTVIALSLIDAAIVITDLSYVFLNQACDGGEPELPLWLEILSHISTCITLSFLIEIPLALWAFGWQYYWPPSSAFPHPGFHLLDAVVIIGSVLIDLVLKGKDKELASLLIVFRLWRIVKVVGGVAVGVSEYNEAAIMELKESKEVIDKLKKQVKELEEENARLKHGAAN